MCVVCFAPPVFTKRAKTAFDDKLKNKNINSDNKHEEKFNEIIENNCYFNGVLFDFSKYERDNDMMKEYDPMVRKISARAEKLADDLMLGDAEEALKALQDFMKMAI